MAGFREFVTGEVLTAANVDDFLMKQSVQKYADAAARDAALGTAVAGGNALREGMVAWLDSDDELIAYDGTAWNPVGTEPPAGIGSNVVQTVKTDTFTTSSSTFTAVTGMSVTITPTSATSKILVLCDVGVGANLSAKKQLRILRDSTVIYLGDASGANPRLWALLGSGGGQSSLFTSIVRVGGVVLDSPNTTSAVTYSLEAQTGSTLHVNRAETDGDGRSASSITAIEVAQ